MSLSSPPTSIKQLARLKLSRKNTKYGLFRRLKLFHFFMVLLALSFSACSSGGSSSKEADANQSSDSSSTSPTNINSSASSSAVSSMSSSSVVSVPSSLNSVSSSTSASISSSSSDASSTSSSGAVISSRSSSSVSSSASLQSSSVSAVPITNGLILHLNGDSAVVDENANTITTWTDISPSGNNATQQSASRRPVSVADENTSLKWVRFDGEDDTMSLMTNIFSSTSLPRTVFSVVSTTDFKGHIIGTGSGSSSYLGSYGFAVGVTGAKPFLKSNSDYEGVWLLSPDNFTLEGPQIIAATFSDTETELRTRCHILTSTEASNPYDYSTARIGGTIAGQEALQADIAEILVYDIALSAEESNAVINYLSEKYELTMNPAEDMDGDSVLDACDDGRVYLSNTEMTTSILFPESNSVDLENFSDVPSAVSIDLHNQSTHIWVTNEDGAEFRTELDSTYTITLVHFWNYFSEGYDVDQVTMTFFNSEQEILSTLELSPSLGDDTVVAEDFPVNVSGVKYINTRLTGTNSQVDFQNIGFSGYTDQ